MKSEPGECSVQSVLAMPNRRVDWFGIRNYQARNFMRDEMNIGDEVPCKIAEIDAQGRINLIRNDIEYDNTEMPRRSAPGQRPPRRDANRR